MDHILGSDVAVNVQEGAFLMVRYQMMHHEAKCVGTGNAVTDSLYKAAKFV